MPEQRTNNVNGTVAKILGTLVAISVIIAGMYTIDARFEQRIQSLGDAMSLRMDYLQTGISVVREELATHSSVPAHQGAVAEMATMRERFREVETQFRWLADVSNLRHGDHERLLSLLWIASGQGVLPATDYWPLGEGDK